MKGTAVQFQEIKPKLRTTNPPVIILGGSDNALSIARSLSRRGIDVFLSVKLGNPAFYTRFAKKTFPIPSQMDKEHFWLDLLLGKRSADLHGSVVLPCNDEGVEFVARHRPQLQNDYILDDSIPEIQLAMLDKQKTLELAQSIGVPTPKFWRMQNLKDLQKIKDEIVFPVIVKPIHSHLFQKHFRTKLFFANGFVDLQEKLQSVLAIGLGVMVTEFVPGPDHLLGSYYTYIDKSGKPIFHYTKRVIRRFPVNQGLGCYHISQWNQEIADLGLKFFKGIQYRGLGNIEFKRDLRDGYLKVIECNPRFTASHELITQSGIDIAEVVYNHLVGLSLPPVDSYRQELRYWYPVRDFRAFLQLKGRNELTFWGWLKSVCHRQVFPHFKWTDPLPSLAPYCKEVMEKILRKS